jgi:hypothetical protein
MPQAARHRLTPGTFYDLTFDLEPDDELFSEQTARRDDHVERPRIHALAKPGAELTIDLAHSSFAIRSSGVAALSGRIRPSHLSMRFGLRHRKFRHGRPRFSPRSWIFRLPSVCDSLRTYGIALLPR